MSTTETIHLRRSVYPAAYDTSHPVERDVLLQLLENACQAPTHKRTEPWRFIVFHSEESRRELGEYLSDYWKANTPPEDFSETKYRKTLENPQKAGAVIAIILQRDLQERLPEWEEMAAVAMAVQNMWLTATDLGLGAYWSTPAAALNAAQWLQLPAGQRCLGLFYVGWPVAVPGTLPRLPVSDIATWR